MNGKLLKDMLRRLCWDMLGGPKLHLQNKRDSRKRVTPGKIRQGMNTTQ